MLLCQEVLPVEGGHQVLHLRGQGGGDRQDNVHQLTEETVNVVRDGGDLTYRPRVSGGEAG